MKKIIITLAAVFIFTTGLNVQAADIAAGKAASVSCAACHGAEGISPTDIWPNLAGQKAGYIAKQLKAFKDGSRADPMMSPLAAPLTDDDIANLAAYYSSL